MLCAPRAVCPRANEATSTLKRFSLNPANEVLLNEHAIGKFRVNYAEAFGGIDNLADRRTIGSVIVNQAGGGFYEPGLPRSWILGVQLKAPI